MGYAAGSTSFNVSQSGGDVSGANAASARTQYEAGVVPHRYDGCMQCSKYYYEDSNAGLTYYPVLHKDCLPGNAETFDDFVLTKSDGTSETVKICTTGCANATGVGGVASLDTANHIDTSYTQGLCNAKELVETGNYYVPPPTVPPPTQPTFYMFNNPNDPGQQDNQISVGFSYADADGNNLNDGVSYIGPYGSTFQRNTFNIGGQNLPFHGMNLTPAGTPAHDLGPYTHIGVGSGQTGVARTSTACNVPQFFGGENNRVAGQNNPQMINVVSPESSWTYVVAKDVCEGFADEDAITRDEALVCASEFSKNMEYSCFLLNDYETNGALYDDASFFTGTWCDDAFRVTSTLDASSGDVGYWAVTDPAVSGTRTRPFDPRKYTFGATAAFLEKNKGQQALIDKSLALNQHNYSGFTPHSADFFDAFANVADATVSVAECDQQCKYGADGLASCTDICANPTYRVNGRHNSSEWTSNNSGSNQVGYWPMVGETTGDRKRLIGPSGIISNPASYPDLTSGQNSINHEAADAANTIECSSSGGQSTDIWKEFGIPGCAVDIRITDGSKFNGDANDDSDAKVCASELAKANAVMGFFNPGVGCVGFDKTQVDAMSKSTALDKFQFRKSNNAGESPLAWWWSESGNDWTYTTNWEQVSPNNFSMFATDDGRDYPKFGNPNATGSTESLHGGEATTASILPDGDAGVGACNFGSQSTCSLYTNGVVNAAMFGNEATGGISAGDNSSTFISRGVTPWLQTGQPELTGTIYNASLGANLSLWNGTNARGGIVLKSDYKDIAQQTYCLLPQSLERFS